MMNILNERIIKVIDQMDNIQQASEQRNSSGLAGVQEDMRSTQRQGASKDGVIRNTHTL